MQYIIYTRLYIITFDFIIYQKNKLFKHNKRYVCTLKDMYYYYYYYYCVYIVSA